MKALFLTAGLATRFRPQTNKIPKPLLPLFTIPLYLYGYELLKSAGAKTFIYNLHHLPEEMKAGILKNQEPGVTTLFSDETSAILGSAGAIKKAEEYFDANEDIFLHNGDEVYFPYEDAITQALHLHRKEGRLATLIVMDHSEAGKKFGAVWINSENKVTGFGKTEIKGSKPKHYIGTMILNTRILSKISLKETNILYDTLLPLLANERVYTHTISCDWFETGNCADYIEAHKEIYSKLSTLKASKHFQHMIKKYVGSELPMMFTGNNVHVSPSATLKGFVWLQDNVNINDNVTLQNVVVTEGVNIAANQTISDQLVV